MPEQYEHHLEIRDARGGRFLEPGQHVLWVDSSFDTRGRPFYERQSGSSKVNLLEVDILIQTLALLNKGLRERGYGPSRTLAAHHSNGTLRTWAEAQLPNAAPETIDDLFSRGQIKLNGRAGRPNHPVSPGDELVLDARKPVGVITFYGAQVREIRQRLTRAENKTPKIFHTLEIRSSTSDRFQGMQRPIILVSMVRSRPHMRGGEYVKQYQRINVAFSRAQELLIIIGAERTFRDFEIELPPVSGGPPRKVAVYRNIFEIVKRFGGRRYARQVLG